MRFVGGVGFTNVDLIYSGMDHLPKKGEETFSRKFEMHLGGGVPATLINTTRLGIPSKILSFIGEDLFSQFVKQSYEKYGVELVNLYEGDGMPVILSSAMVCQGDRSFLSYRDEVEINEATLQAVYQELKGASVVSMHLGFLDVYQKLKQEGCIHIFDTGWDDELSIEKYEEYLKVADYYIPNQKEALKITGENTLEGAAEKLSQYFEHVIIKLDKDGCLLKNKNGTMVISAMEGVEAVDSTGAGDAFQSGFIYGIYHNYPIEDCIKFGNVTGGTCVKSMGCLTSYVTEVQLQELAEKLTVKFVGKEGN